MKTFQAKSLLTAILLLLNIASLAQSQESERRREGEGREQDRDRGRDRRWDPDEYLKRMDSNGDGKLDPSEMSGRAERFIGEMGFDTSKPILLSSVSEKIKADRGEKTTTPTKKTPPPKVPGFGASNEKIAGFGKPETKPLETTFSESILQQVDQIMKTYDKDQNGFLEGEELVSIPWGPPSYQESDIDRDGKISKEELATRYRAREQNVRATSNNSNSSRRSTRGGQSNREKNDEDRGRFASDSSSSGSSNRSTRSSSKRDSTTEKGGSESTDSKTRKPRVVDESERKRIEKYADFIFEKYDKDKDQRLTVEEAKEIRNPPKADNDGTITRTAYVEFLLNPDAQKTEKPASDSKAETPAAESKGSESKASESKASESKSSDSSRSGRSTGRSRSGDSKSGSASSKSTSRKTSFEDYDENGNGTVEMHEYSGEWSESVLKEFYEKDKNRDGIITQQEWRG